jgi:hypothetical protein
MHLHLILYAVAVALAFGLAGTVTIAAAYAGTYSKTWTVVSSADADTTQSVSHGFGAAPALYWLTPLLPQAYGKQWTIAVTSTLITVTGISSTGAGTTSAQLLISAMLPNSLIG